MGASYRLEKALGLLFIITTVLQFLFRNHLFDNTAIDWVIEYAIYIIIVYFICKEHSFFRKETITSTIFIFYSLFQVVRAIFYSSDYWETKQLITNMTAVLFPLFCFAFTSPTKVLIIFKYWYKFAVPAFFVFLFLRLQFVGGYHFTMGPLYFLFGSAFFFLPTKGKFVVGPFILLMIFADFYGSRSQTLKGLITVFTAFGFLLYKYIPRRLLEFVHYLLYIIPVVLLYLGLSGQYNIFRGDKENEVIVTAESGTTIDEDTRSGLYEEIIVSALVNDYVILGRTPARGNDTEIFANSAKNAGMVHIERAVNELCHPNIFTWMGIIGVILYSLIYLQASILALYYTNNHFMPIFSVVVAFHWLYGWVEDTNQFSMLNVGLWLIIAMCMSKSFREMSDLEFRLWLKNFYADSLYGPYYKYKIVKGILLSRIINYYNKAQNQDK